MVQSKEPGVQSQAHCLIPLPPTCGTLASLNAVPHRAIEYNNLCSGSIIGLLWNIKSKKYGSLKIMKHYAIALIFLKEWRETGWEFKQSEVCGRWGRILPVLCYGLLLGVLQQCCLESSVFQGSVKQCFQILPQSHSPPKKIHMHTHVYTHVHSSLWDSNMNPGSQVRNRLKKQSPCCVSNFSSLITG